MGVASGREEGGGAKMGSPPAIVVISGINLREGKIIIVIIILAFMIFVINVGHQIIVII